MWWGKVCLVRRWGAAGKGVTMKNMTLGIILWSCLAVTLQAAPQSLADYKAIYSRESAAINTNTDWLGEASLQYIKTLQDMEVAFKKSGDFPNTKATLDERKQFELYKTVPTESPSSTPPEIAKAQAVFRAAQARAITARDARLAKLTRQYVKVLKNHMKTLLEQDKMAEAEETNKETLRVEAILKTLDPELSTPAEVAGVCPTERPTVKLLKKEWNLVRSFSTVMNPTGPWSYGWTSETGGKFNLYRKQLHSPELKGRITGWALGDNNPPVVWMNPSNTEICRIRHGQVSSHPGPSGQHSIIRWTSPGTYHVGIEGRFGAGDLGAMSVQVLHNDKVIFSAPNTPKDEPFSLDVEVKSGDTVDFDVATGMFGYGCIPPPVEATIVTK